MVYTLTKIFIFPRKFAKFCQKNIEKWGFLDGKIEKNSAKIWGFLDEILKFLAVIFLIVFLESGQNFSFHFFHIVQREKERREIKRKKKNRRGGNSIISNEKK